MFEKICKQQNKINEKEAINFISQILQALDHMHEIGYVHLDLKPENIMFVTKESDKLKLIDFGLATKVNSNKPVKVTLGKVNYIFIIS